MEKQIIYMFQYYKADLFSRSKALELDQLLTCDKSEVELDFTDIGFMSRSFTDELFNVVEAHSEKTIIYSNCNENVKAMMEKVAEGRRRNRQLGIPEPQMLEFDKINEFSEFLTS